MSLLELLSDVLTCRQDRAKLRTRVGMLEADNTYLRKAAEWAADENVGLRSAVAGLERELRRVSLIALRASGHPSVRQRLREDSDQN